MKLYHFKTDLIGQEFDCILICGFHVGNPVERKRRFQIELLVLNIGLKRIDKEDYLEEDVEEAKEIIARRRQRAERKEAR